MQERKQQKERPFTSEEFSTFVIHAAKVKERLEDRLSKQNFNESCELKEYIFDEMPVLANAVNQVLNEANALNLPDFHGCLKRCISRIGDVTTNYQDKCDQNKFDPAPYPNIVERALWAMRLYINILKYISFVDKSYPGLCEGLLTQKGSSRALAYSFFGGSLAGAKKEKDISTKKWSEIDASEQASIKERFITSMLDRYFDEFKPDYMDRDDIDPSTIFLNALDYQIEYQRKQTPYLNEKAQDESYCMTDFKFLIDLNDYKTLCVKVMLDFYLQALKYEKKDPYFFCLCTPEQIRKFIDQQKNENNGCVTLSLKRLFWDDYPLDQAQWQALQESMRDANSLILEGHIYSGFMATNEQWELLSDLVKSVTILSFKGCPIGLTPDTLASFKNTIQSVKSLDISNILLEPVSEEAVEALAHAIQHCECLHLGGKLKNNLSSLYFSLLKHAHPASLLLDEIWLADPKFKIASLPVFCSESLSLRCTWLENLPLPEWKSLGDKLIYVRNLDLSFNTFSIWRDEKLGEFVSILSNPNLNWLNIDHCGFDICNDSKWTVFCNALRLYKITCFIAPISNLSLERRNELDTILQENACSTSLVSACRYTIWSRDDSLSKARQSGILPIDLQPDFDGDTKLTVLHKKSC